MSNYCPSIKMSSWKYFYKDPLKYQPDHFGYKPQMTLNSTPPSSNVGTKSWFQDYRRSSVCENVLQKNLKTLNTAVRPTHYSDKPDIVLGCRKMQRESLFPVIHNNNVYVLINRHCTKESDMINFKNDVKEQREKYKNFSKNDYQMKRFYHPFKADETFQFRDISKNGITSYPSHLTSAKEFVVKKQRESPSVDYRSLYI